MSTSVAVDRPVAPLASRWMLPVICSAAFLVFVQAFMVAPLIPRLADVFDSPVGLIGLAVPAYLLPHGLATLVWGPLSDRLGRRTVILGSLLLFIAFTLATAFAASIDAFLAWRVATGVGAAGVVPISLTLIGDVVPFQRRGRALGWLFGSIAGGTATGATVGALMEPVVGWAGLFLGVAVIGASLVAVAIGVGAFPRLPRAGAPAWSVIVQGYCALLSLARAQRTYAYVLINALVQSGSTHGWACTCTSASD